MAVTQLKYNYTIKLSFLVNGKEIKIGTESIEMAMLTYEYTKINAPITIIKLKLLTEVYNKLQNNQEKSKAIFELKKLDDKNNTPVTYIKKEFSYYFPSYNNASNNDTGEEFTEGNLDAYVNCIIGLLDPVAINANKIFINDRYLNSNTISIIHQYTKSLKMVLEPFDYNDPMEICYIHPIEGISKLLEFLNEQSTFYSTGYRFFMDYKYTYLLSNKGTPIDIKDQTYTTVQFQVDRDIKYDGLGIDKENKLYMIKIEENQIDIGADRITDKLYTELVGIDYTGKIKKVKLDIHNEKDSSKNKPKIMRIHNNNFNMLEEMKNLTEATGDIVTISTIDIDNSLIVPYKEFIIKFNKERKEMSGKYTLYNKREIYTNEGDDVFKGSINISLIKKS